MGRTWDALRRDDIVSSETEQARVLPAPTEDAEPMLAATEEIPFIEVGPRRSLEASPSVLAYPAAASGEGRGARGEKEEPSSLATRPSLLATAEPRSVQFRAAPSGAKRSSLASELVAYHAANQSAAQQYRDVLGAVLKASAASSRPSALLFTSAAPRIGATTALLNVAITAASHLRQRIIVVDTNFRRPALAERLGLLLAPGLREAMAGAVALDEVIQTTEQTNLFAVTAGVRTVSGVRIVPESLRSLLRQLCQRYPLVFVDGPNWDGKSDVTALGSACDAVFLVVPETEAETSQTDGLIQLISTQGARLAGCILVTDL
jgi:Mrp family chromosome partitioning ATPase